MHSDQHRKIGAALVAAIGLSSFAALAADDGFVQKAAMGGIAEVDAGGMAQDKGSSPAVKDFGQKMVQDHTKANDELKQIATSKNMAVPTSPDDKHKKSETKLGGMTGQGFDQAFKAQMIADHKATISLFEHEAKSGTDADLKAFAAKTLPDLKDHLKMAQALP